MSELSFDILTRQAAAAISRRRSLLALGGVGAAAATLASPVGNAARKKKKKDPNKKCQEQIGRCKTSWENLCGELNCQPATRAALLACCGLLGTCDIADYNICVLGSLF